MAKDQGIVGWHAMRKDQLIRALTLPPAASKKGQRPSPDGGEAAGRAAGVPDVRASSGDHAAPASRRLTVMPPRPLEHACVKDRIIAMVRDPYWLHAYWELSRSTSPAPRPRSARSGTPPGRSSG